MQVNYRPIETADHLHTPSTHGALIMWQDPIIVETQPLPKTHEPEGGAGA